MVPVSHLQLAQPLIINTMLCQSCQHCRTRMTELHTSTQSRQQTGASTQRCAPAFVVGCFSTQPHMQAIEQWQSSVLHCCHKTWLQPGRCQLKHTRACTRNTLSLYPRIHTQMEQPQCQQTPTNTRTHVDTHTPKHTRRTRCNRQAHAEQQSKNHTCHFSTCNVPAAPGPKHPASPTAANSSIHPPCALQRTGNVQQLLACKQPPVPV